MPQIDAHPAALRENVVWFGATSGHQLIPDLLREGNIHQAVTVYMPDFSSPETVLCASEAMGLGCDPRPALQSGIDSFFGSGDAHQTPTVLLPISLPLN